jgi:aldehyde:ferredoxin oxidoreductase
MNDSIGFCDWFFPIITTEPLFKDESEEGGGGIHLGDLTVEAQMFSAATGIEKSIEDLLKDAKRIITMERAIQVRMGRRREDDTFNEYYFNRPDRTGTYIDRVAWEKVKTDWYEIVGWDPETGIPTRESLEDLDLRDVANSLGV